MKPIETKKPDDDFAEIDLGPIADFLHALYPRFSRCELIKMLVTVAQREGCTCSLCTPTKFPGCQEVQT